MALCPRFVQSTNAILCSNPDITVLIPCQGQRPDELMLCF